MYFYPSAFCGMAISCLSIVVRTTITAALQAWRFVVAIVLLFLASVLVRYVVFVDYKKAVTIAVAMGLVPWIREAVIILLLSCIVDILEYTIGTARAISLMTASKYINEGYEENIPTEDLSGGGGARCRNSLHLYCIGHSLYCGCHYDSV